MIFKKLDGINDIQSEINALFNNINDGTFLFWEEDQTFSMVVNHQNNLYLLDLICWDGYSDHGVKITDKKLISVSDAEQFFLKIREEEQKSFLIKLENQKKEFESILTK